MTEMRAVGFTKFGDPSVLRVVSLPIPSPGPGQLRVKVVAATVNPTDIAFRQGGR
jgi:NADPH:quinone reductase